MDAAQSPVVQASGCIKVMDFTLVGSAAKDTTKTNSIFYNALGKYCVIQFGVTFNQVNADTHLDILTIPAGYRPPRDVYTAGTCGYFGYCQIWLKASTGRLEVWCGSGTMNYARGTVIYYL